MSVGVVTAAARRRIASAAVLWTVTAPARVPTRRCINSCRTTAARHTAPPPSARPSPTAAPQPAALRVARRRDRVDPAISVCSSGIMNGLICRPHCAPVGRTGNRECLRTRSVPKELQGQIVPEIKPSENRALPNVRKHDLIPCRYYRDVPNNLELTFGTAAVKSLHVQ